LTTKGLKEWGCRTGGEATKAIEGTGKNGGLKSKLQNASLEPKMGQKRRALSGEKKHNNETGKQAPPEKGWGEVIKGNGNKILLSKNFSENEGPVGVMILSCGRMKNRKPNQGGEGLVFIIKLRKSKGKKEEKKKV